MKYELIIFDLDGTLLNTISDLGAAVDFAMKSKGFATHSDSEYQTMVGHGIRNLVIAALPEAFRQSAIIDACLDKFITYYQENIDVHTRPYPGVYRLLKDLDKAGIKLAVASNKFQAGTETLVKRFFPDIPFVAVFGNKEGQPLKPSPELVNTIMSMAFPEGGEHTAAFVGDSDTDVKTASNAGIPCLAVTWGFRTSEQLADAGATTFASSASELKKLIL